MVKRITEEWKNYLNSGKSYRHKINNKFQYYKFKLNPFSTSLKQIIKLGKIKPGKKILDFGAGGGHDTVPLAYLGCDVDALDCSDVVLNNLIRYKESVEKYSKRKLKINLIEADILKANLQPNKYDVIFSCGVVEHFMEDEERASVYDILSKSLKKDGYLITSVPNGNHPLRARQKNERLGGYHIEEIDYSLEVFKKDISKTDVAFEKVKGFNLFGFIFILPIFVKYGMLKAVVKPFYLLCRVVENWIPFRFMKNYAFWLIFIARKEKSVFK